MLFFAAPAMAAAIAFSELAAPRHRHHHHKAANARLNSRDYIRTREEIILRRRVARMTRLALLQRREALLHDFLIQANTELPIFRDDRTYRFESGVAIGPAQITQDFVGSPIIRAHVVNLRQTRLFVLLEAIVTTADGRVVRATTAVELRAREVRSLELLCPEKVTPATLIWNTMPL